MVLALGRIASDVVDFATSEFALVELDGVRVLTDPMWSERASPLTWVGPRRYFEPPIALRDLPEIDAVVISHDHYDHLDYRTILAMKDWRTVFVVRTPGHFELPSCHDVRLGPLFALGDDRRAGRNRDHRERGHDRDDALHGAADPVA